MNPVLNLSESFTCSLDALWALLTERRDAWWGEGVVELRKVDPPKLSLAPADDTLVILVVQGSADAPELSILHSRFESSEARDAEAARWNDRVARLRSLL